MPYDNPKLPFASYIFKMADSLDDEFELRSILVRFYEDRGVEAVDQGDLISGRRYREYRDHLESEADAVELYSVATTIIKAIDALFTVVHLPLPKEKS